MGVKDSVRRQVNIERVDPTPSVSVMSAVPWTRLESPNSLLQECSSLLTGKRHGGADDGGR